MREAKFLQDLIEAVRGGDQQQFATVCYTYDQVTPLDKLKLALLTKIKATIDEEPDLR
jgi:alpha-soluble NSF attachment protein